jgi:hypothetical protein
MRKLALATAALFLFAGTAPAQAHLVVKSKPGQPAWKIEQNQFRNLEHAAYVAEKGGGTNQLWHKKAVSWLWASHDRLMWNYISPWLPTYNCEHGRGGWESATGNGFYGGLQFHPGTWLSNGGGKFARSAHEATPIQQVTIAWKLGPSHWPNCPTPF